VKIAKIKHVRRDFFKETGVQQAVLGVQQVKTVEKKRKKKQKERKRNWA